MITTHEIVAKIFFEEKIRVMETYEWIGSVILILFGMLL